jgi:hypothetical protein
MNEWETCSRRERRSCTRDGVQRKDSRGKRRVKKDEKGFYKCKIRTARRWTGRNGETVSSSVVVCVVVTKDEEKKKKRRRGI